jgi:ADP-heptose:LPS heptosyltransferase
VCRTGAFGDVCMAMPVVRALSAHCEVHWLVRQRNDAVLRLFPEVPCHPVILEYDFEKHLPAVAARLASCDYDVLLDFSNWDSIAHLVRRLKHIPIRAIAYDRTRRTWPPRLRNAMPWNRPFNRIVQMKGAVHRTVRYRHLVQAVLGWRLTLDWPLPALDVPADGVRLFVHPHASRPETLWSIDNFAMVIGRAAALGVTHCVINEGFDRERAVAVDLGRRLRNAGLDVTFVPFDPSFAGLKAALETAHAAIGADSGPMHLASLLGVPSVIVYGPYAPSEVAPLWRMTAVTPPGGLGPTRRVSPEMVLAALDATLSKARADPGR